MDVEAPERWGRLLEDHWRQAEAREAEVRRARRQLPLVAALGVTLLVSVGALFLGAMSWIALERGVRDDPSRCPSGPGRPEVAVGGWSEPDRCFYYDDDGELAYDGNQVGVPPGPVTRTYGNVLGDGAETLAVWAVPTLGLTGVVLVRRSRRRLTP